VIYWGNNAQKDLKFFSLLLILNLIRLQNRPVQGVLCLTKFPSLRRELGVKDMQQPWRAITPCPQACGKAARRGKRDY